MLVQNATVLVALATFVGALVGATAQFVIHRLDIQRERESLRKALASELRSQPSLDDDRWQQLPHIENPESMISNTVYASNTANVGLLSPDEAESVVTYHSTLKMFVELNRGLDDAPEDHDAWDSIDDLRERLEQKRTESMEELENNTGGLFRRLDSLVS